MEKDERKLLAEQRATNAQTVTFVANQQADIVTAAEERAETDPRWSRIAAIERTRVESLMEVAEEERRLATALTLGTEADGTVAAAERELRKDVLEISRAEGHMADTLRELETENDYGPVLLAEQAEWSRDLLRHVARTATDADRNLRLDDSLE